MIKKFSFLVLLLLLSVISYSQNNETETFKPEGKVILTGFFDYSTDFHKESGFDMTRALLGYNYKFTPNLSAQVVVDAAAGSTKDNGLQVYLRNAFVRWQEAKLKIDVGMVGLNQFSLQERYWGHRYAISMAQDIYKMGYSVDLGFTAEYDFNDFVSADISFTNGTGYKNVKKSNSKRHSLGVTFRPLKDFVFRAYSDLYNKSSELRDELPAGVNSAEYRNQYNLGLFVGYQNQKVSAGAEFNKLYNKGFVQDKDFYSVSFYSTVNILPKWNVYARYDYTDSTKPKLFTSSWNDLDGQLFMAGLEFVPIKYIKISPNFRNINPMNGESQQYFFINMEFKL